MRKVCLIVCTAFALLAQQGTQTLYLGQLTTASATPGQNLPIPVAKHTLQVVVTGSPAACAIQLEGTLDKDATASSATWANLSGSQTCTATVTFHVIDRAVNGVRANLTALSGGTAPTVTIK